jgi:hypothetical protein
MLNNRIWNAIRKAEAPAGILPLVFAAALAAHGQPAKGANKFLGNITSRGQVRSDFA